LLESSGGLASGFLHTADAEELGEEPDDALVVSFGCTGYHLQKANPLCISYFFSWRIVLGQLVRSLWKNMGFLQASSLTVGR
jgi:hypothetical protein